jgi:hypothetical protein
MASNGGKRRSSIGVAIVPKSTGRLTVSNIQFCELEEAPIIEHMNPALRHLVDIPF